MVAQWLRHCAKNRKVAVSIPDSAIGILSHTSPKWGPLMVTQWLRHCATNRKVAGSIPDGAIGIFH
jgi:hypothetical protein